MARLRVVGPVVVALAVLGSLAGRVVPALGSDAMLSATAVDPSSTMLHWSVPPTVATVELYRDGFLLDRFPASLANAYTARLLWPSTAYRFEVRGLDPSGAVVTDVVATTTTPARSTPFPRLYARTSFWNTPIRRGTPTDPNSATMVASALAAFAPWAVMNDNDHWGVPLTYASVQDRMYDVACRNPGCSPATVPFRIPAGAQPNLGSDGKLVVVDPTTGEELDMGRATHDQATDSWSTGNRMTTSTTGWGAMCGIGQHCGGIVASGLAQFGGVVRPEEIAQGHIDHALALVSPFTSSTSFVCPATRLGGGHDDPSAIPLGAHVQLDPHVDVAAQPWPTWEKVVARALQTYGAYVVDAGTQSLEIRAESVLNRGYDAWALAGVPDQWPGGPTLRDIPWDRMRVLAMTTC